MTLSFDFVGATNKSFKVTWRLLSQLLTTTVGSMNLTSNIFYAADSGLTVTTDDPNFLDNVTPQPVPIPAPLALFLNGLAGLGMLDAKINNNHGLFRFSKHLR